MKLNIKIEKDAPVPIYFQISESISEMIECGDILPGDKLPTEIDLSKELNVNRLTVGHAYTDLKKRGFVVQYRGKGTFVAGLKIDYRKVVGVLIPDITRGIYPKLMKGIEGVLYTKNYGLLLCNSEDDFKKQGEYVKMLIEKKISGVILIPIYNDRNYERNIEAIERLHNKGIPVVQLDRFVDSNVDYVTTDNVEGAHKLTKYLLGKGHKKIGVIRTPLCSSVLQRLEGYRRALREAGLETDEGLIKPILGGDRFICSDAIRSFLQLKDPPTAIFAIHDLIAINAINLLRKKGLRVPEDVAVVGYDNLELAQFCSVPLTTMAQPLIEMGKRAAQILIGRMEEKAKFRPSRVVLQSELVMRQSA